MTTKERCRTCKTKERCRERAERKKHNKRNGLGSSTSNFFSPY